MNPIRRLRELGQSVWLDFLERELLSAGKLDALIERDGLQGLTSNPTIFQKAIAVRGAYDEDLRATSAGETDLAVLERLTVRDIQAACDRLRTVHDRTEGRDGFVSIEVSPRVAYDTEASVEEAGRLWKQVARPNVMVKIPGTREGVAAVFRCVSEGINVNITLLFSVSRYLEVVETYQRALEARLAKGQPIDRLASVASFFVSRVDTKVDKALDALRGSRAACGAALRGRIAIANAKVAYEEYERITASERWKALEAAGARSQRLLWASTSPKDPAYDDLYYAEALVGPETVDTMTEHTFRTYLERGRPEVRLTSDRDQAHRQIAALEAIGLDLGRMLFELEDEGVKSFADSFRRALETVAERRREIAIVWGPRRVAGGFS